MNEEKEHSQYRYLLRRMLYPTVIFAILIGLAITFRNISKLSDKPPPQNTPTVSLVDFSEVISDSVAYELTPTTDGSSSSVHPLPQAQTGGDMASYPPPPTSPPSYPGPGQGMVVYPTATPDWIKLPECRFDKQDMANTHDEPVKTYKFSEAKPIIPGDVPYKIVQWLPDSQRILGLHYTKDMLYQNITTFDIETKKEEFYGKRRDGSGYLPSINHAVAWLPNEKAVVYFDSYIKEQRIERSLWIGYGNGKVAKQLSAKVNDLANIVIDEKILLPKLQETIAFSPPFDANKWKYPKYPRFMQLFDLGYKWYSDYSFQPNGHLIEFNAVPWWLFLADIETEEACEVNLGEITYETAIIPYWPLNTRWSPNGRYLAMQISLAPPEFISYASHVAIVDTWTGEVYKPDFDLGWVKDTEWLPDSNHLLVLGDFGNDALFMVNVPEKKVEHIMPDYTFGRWGSRQMLTSPDGKWLAITCPYEVGLEHYLCLMAIEPIY